jgi:hypothetical protein
VQVRTVEPDEQIAMEVLSSPRAMQFFRALIEIFQAQPKKKSPATLAPDLATSPGLGHIGPGLGHVGPGFGYIGRALGHTDRAFSCGTV